MATTTHRPTAHFSTPGVVAPGQAYDNNLSTSADLIENGSSLSQILDLTTWPTLGSPTTRLGLRLRINAAWMDGDPGDFLFVTLSLDGGIGFGNIVDQQIRSGGGWGPPGSPAWRTFDIQSLVGQTANNLLQVRLFFLRSSGAWTPPPDAGWQCFEIELEEDQPDPAVRKDEVDLDVGVPDLELRALDVRVSGFQAAQIPQELEQFETGIAPTNPAAPVWPWLRFFDYTSKLDTSGFTPEQQQQIAALGMGLFDFSRILSDNGQIQVAAILGYNPSFILDSYWESGVFKPDVVGSTSRPLGDYWHRELIGREARHMDGTILQAWPPPAGSGSLSQWHEWLDAQDQLDVDLVVRLWDAALQVGVDRGYTIYPEAQQFDYVPCVTGSQFCGPWVWSDFRTAHGDCDSNQNGTPYHLDNAEVDGYLAFWLKYAEECRRAMGSTFIIHPNGTGGLREPELTAAFNGNDWEGFPNTFFQSNPRLAIQDLHRVTQEMVPVRGAVWNMLLLRTNQDRDTIAANSQVMACRICSMIWNTPWSYLPNGEADLLYEDPEADHFAGAGDAISEIYYEQVSGTEDRWWRYFHGGKAEILVDDSSWSATWTPGSFTAPPESIVDLQGMSDLEVSLDGQ